MSIDEAMEIGASRYRSALAALRRMGLPADFTQTGGMCAAIEVRLEGGPVLLITDHEESLPWNPRQQIGWGVGLYDSNDVSEGPVHYVGEEATDVETLCRLVRTCLRDGTACLGRGR